MGSSGLLRVSTVLSLSFRTRPWWWTVVATTDRRRVHCTSPSTPVLLDTCDGASSSRRSVLHNRHARQRPYFQGSLIFFQVSFNGHMWRTVVPMTVRPAWPSYRSETPLLRVSIFFPSVLRRISTTDRRNCDGPSCTHRHASQRLSFRVLYLYRVQVQHDGPHDGPS